MTLLECITKILSKEPGHTARTLKQRLQIQYSLDVEKRQINKVLYSQLSPFRCDSGSPPRWYLAQHIELKIAPVPNRPIRPRPLKARSQERRLYAWQHEALEAWRQNDYQGVIEAVTGTGKTQVGITAAEEEVLWGGKVLVLVPSHELLRQWQQNIRRQCPQARIGEVHGGASADFIDCDIIVAVVNSARNADLTLHEGEGLLIADECHRYGSDCNKDALDERFSRRLGLTATYERNDNGHIQWLDPYFGGICYEMDYQRALRDNVVAPFSVALVGVRFSDEERAEYEERSEQLRRLKNYLVNGLNIPEEPFGEFIKTVSTYAKGGYELATIKARQYLNAFEKRRKLLAEMPAKMEALHTLSGAIREASRTIVFTQTIDGANCAAEALQAIDIRAHAIHSKLLMDERRAILNSFEKGLLDVIVAPQILDEGVDVPEADLAIIIATTKTLRQMVQRLGRVLRRKKDGRLARLALLYVEETSEDPDHGAHEDFIDEIEEVAERFAKFSSKSSHKKICNFLSDTEPMNPTAIPRMATGAGR